jgi:hypothetical protein
LQVSDHADIIINDGECLRLFELIDNHYLKWLLLKLHVLIMIFVSQELSKLVVGGREHQLAFVVRVGEDSLGHSTVVHILIEEELI